MAAFEYTAFTIGGAGAFRGPDVVGASGDVLMLDDVASRTTKWGKGIDQTADQLWTGVNRFRNAAGIYIGDTADRVQMAADAGAGGRLLIGRAGTPSSSAIIADGQFQLRQGTNVITFGPSSSYATIRGDISQLKLLCPTTGLGMVVTDTAEAKNMPVYAGASVFGDVTQTATNIRQLTVRKGGTGGPDCFYVTNRNGAGLDLGIDRYLNLTRDGFANGQIGVGGGGVSTFRAAETNVPIMVQGRGSNNSFGGCVFILNRTAPTDAALTPLIRFGVGLAYNSVTPDVDIFHGLHTLFHTGIRAPNLPTTDPAVAGELYVDASGFVKQSAG